MANLEKAQEPRLFGLWFFRYFGFVCYLEGNKNDSG